jgi:hypothetical protein
VLPPLAFTSRHAVEADRPSPLGDHPAGQTGGQTPRDLLALLERQSKIRALPPGRSPTAGIGDELPKRRVLPTQVLGDALHRHAGLAHLPDRLPLFL